jgi:hypothetical protein
MSSMISAIEWIPAGVADPNPKKYEFSPAELELIQMMEKQDLNMEEGAPKEAKKNKNKLKIEHNLPADLRMDEYSSDEDENDAVQGTAIGALLVEDDAELMEETEEEEPEEDEEDEKEKSGDEMDSDDSDEDDDLADVPDTREFTALDVEGFKAMGLSQVGTSAPTYMDLPGEGDDGEDDDSEAEDVQIQPGDALLVVAKTEEVSYWIALRIPVYYESVQY